MKHLEDILCAIYEWLDIRGLSYIAIMILSLMAVLGGLFLLLTFVGLVAGGDPFLR